MLFSYDRLDVPPGVELLAAEEIVSEGDRAAFFAMAPGQFGQFSDLFRYELLRSRGGWWVDTDVLCLSPVLPCEEVVIGLKAAVKHNEPFRINNAVMRFPAGHALLEEASVFFRANLNLIGSSWRSVMGPDLLTRLVPKYGIEPREISLFYPITGRGAWQFCDPDKRDEVVAAVSGSPMVHLWQERFRAAGLPRDKLPPTGSFLTELFIKHGGGGAASLSQDEFRAFASKMAIKKSDKRPAKKRPPKTRVSRLRSAIRRLIRA